MRHLIDAIARIDIGASRGTGTLITDRLVLTALHVVADRNETPAAPFPGTIRLTFPGGAVDARILTDHIDAESDWVLLECEPPPGTRPMPLAEVREEDNGQDFWTYGFPAMQPKDGMQLSGAIENVDGRLSSVSAIQLFCEQAAAGDGAPVEGLSGAPLIVDNALVGVIRVALMKRDDSDRRTRGGTLYACPMSTVIDRCGALLPVPDPCRGLPGLVSRDLPAAPIRYLERFTEKDAAIFFGRNVGIRQLYDSLTSEDGAPIVLVYGQAGVGKSSLLDAGVRPRLGRTHDVRYVVRDATSTLLDTLQNALTGGPSRSKATAETMAAAWRNAEAAASRPVVVILDEVEEVFTHPRPDADEVAELFGAMAALHSKDAARPLGRLVVAFRKEWLPEIQERLKPFALGREKFFVESLDRQAIIDVVKGIPGTRRLQQRYKLEIEAGLPEEIADDLVSDRGSAIAPTLQLVLSLLWEAAQKESQSPPRFTKAAYHSLQRDGLLGGFLDTQLAGIREARPELVDSGFALDVLAHHTTPLLAAEQRSRDSLNARYLGRGDDLDYLLNQFKERYLLVDAASETSGSHGATRLAHDSLAPVVRARFDLSLAPGQRARRVIDGRGHQVGDQPDELLDQYDLTLVEQGLDGMRALQESERALLAKSKAKVEKDSQYKKRVRDLFKLAALALFAVAAWGAWELRLARLWQNRLRVQVQEPLMALGWGEEPARYPKTDAIAASMGADYELEQLKVGGVDRHFTVVYPPTAANSAKVIALLREREFLVDSAEASVPGQSLCGGTGALPSGPLNGVPAGEGAMSAVDVLYGADVDMRAVQKVAYILIRAGIAVHGIDTYRDPGLCAGIVRVVAASEGSKPKAVYDIQGLASEAVTDPVFAQLEEHLQGLGAAVEKPIQVRATVQPFEKGLALWIAADAGVVHVLFADGLSRKYQDRSDSSVLPGRRSQADPKEANFNPAGGFRRAWTQYSLKPSLGLPVQPEKPDQSYTLQRFAHGFMVRPFEPWDARSGRFDPAGILVVSEVGDGKWTSVPVP